jgi:uncharacterized protein (TIGR02271 family)
MANRDEMNTDKDMSTTRRDALDTKIDTRTETTRMTGRTDETVNVPVIEEELAVGKRTVETGGVRVHSSVTETPVNESVRLHEEHVNVERRPVDRELRADDMTAFREGTIEMREMAEEAVVEKKARVVEEVRISKEASERTEQISDTVRRTDVQVEPIATGITARAGSFDSITDSCRTHYTSNFKDSGYSFDDYSHAYRYGYEMSGSDNLRGREWSSLEGDVRSTWETKNKGTWDRFKDAVKYGYEQGRH